MDLQLQGKRVLVTGATGGIGGAIVDAFAAEGAKVAICARTAESLDRMRERLAARGADVLAKTADVGEPAQIAALVEAVEQAWDGLDVLISTVSSMGMQGSDESWEAALRTDVLSTVRLVRSCTPLLQKSGSGAIVIIGSSASTEIAPRFVSLFGGEQPYGAVKAAVVNYVKNLSTQLAAAGVRVNVVSPGNVYIPGGPWDALKAQMPGLFEAMIAENPTGRMATPAEVADCVVFLASARASFVTGQNLIVDGGLTRTVRV